MPRNGFSALSGTAIQSISRRMKSSSSLALIGPPKITDAGMVAHRRRQRIVESRTAHVERMTELLERAADAARRGMFLVQDDQDRLAHDRRRKFR